MSRIVTVTSNSVGLRVHDIRTSGWTEIQVDYAYSFNIQNQIENKQYSPLYSTTFDLMSDAQIQAQIDYAIEKYGLSYPLIDFEISQEQLDYYYNLYRSLKDYGETQALSLIGTKQIEIEEELESLYSKHEALDNEVNNINEIKFKETANNLRPLATFILDDGWAKDLTRIKPLFDQKGIVGCSAIISNNIGQTNYMTLEQIRILKDSGWEIMSHSKTHPVLTEISELDLNEELGGSFRDLNSLGLEVENMVIPFSQHNARVREV